MDKLYNVRVSIIINFISGERYISKQVCTKDDCYGAIERALDECSVKMSSNDERFVRGYYSHFLWQDYVDRITSGNPCSGGSKTYNAEVIRATIKEKPKTKKDIEEERKENIRSRIQALKNEVDRILKDDLDKKVLFNTDILASDGSVIDSTTKEYRINSKIYNIKTCITEIDEQIAEVIKGKKTKESPTWLDELLELKLILDNEMYKAKLIKENL